VATEDVSEPVYKNVSKDIEHLYEITKKLDSKFDNGIDKVLELFKEFKNEFNIFKNDLTNKSVAESEALYLLGLYSDINEIHTINSLDELNRIDQVISALQTFDRVSKSNAYAGLIQALNNIKSKFHFSIIKCFFNLI
jgi:hypothetical protein